MRELRFVVGIAVAAPMIFLVLYLPINADFCCHRASVLVQYTLTIMDSEPRPGISHQPLASEKVLIERKIFFLDLKENQRGRFLKITEDVGGRRNTILIPSEVFRDILEALTRLVEFESKL